MIDYNTIRQDIREKLDNYAQHGTPTGDFLRAVLSNDLMEAVGRADDYNITTVHSICGYVYNELPSRCHGSPEIYRSWIERHEEARKMIKATA